MEGGGTSGVGGCGWVCACVWVGVWVCACVCVGGVWVCGWVCNIFVQLYFFFVFFVFFFSLAAEVSFPKGGTIQHVSCGHAHCVALNNHGQLFSWGDNTYGQLGVGKNSGSKPM